MKRNRQTYEKRRKEDKRRRKQEEKRQRRFNKKKNKQEETEQAETEPVFSENEIITLPKPPENPEADE